MNLSRGRNIYFVVLFSGAGTNVLHIQSDVPEVRCSLVLISTCSPSTQFVQSCYNMIFSYVGVILPYHSQDDSKWFGTETLLHAMTILNASFITGSWYDSVGAEYKSTLMSRNTKLWKMADFWKVNSPLAKRHKPSLFFLHFFDYFDFSNFYHKTSFITSKLLSLDRFYHQIAFINR